MPKTTPLPPDETSHDRQPDMPQPSRDEPVTPPVTDKDDPNKPDRVPDPALLPIGDPAGMA
ncbi:hypothetical protein JNB71_08150 [Rhizobium herbae]|uniref:Uncharacterized protein n=1 Tax=Rhizobium herbae TaxID=508661 RepID=A0ABS7H965_9HYPH|nr:hypothetical protein [Rhizobium herbae]MBW9063286.1 hypothetical protein [Rhizobium herbae]